jgi:hypothetical protein
MGAKNSPEVDFINTDPTMGPAQEQPQADAQAGQQQNNVEEADYTIVDDKN